MKRNSENVIGYIAIARGLLDSFQQLPDIGAWKRIAASQQAQQQGQLQKALGILDSVSHVESDVEDFAATCTYLLIHMIAGNLSKAVPYAERLATHTLLKVPSLDAVASLRLGAFYRLQRNHGKAMRLLTRSAEHFRDFGWDNHEALAVAEIGSVQCENSDLFGALSSYLSILDTLKRHGNARPYAVLLRNIAGLCARMGDYDEAEQRLRELLQIHTFSIAGTDRADVLLALASFIRTKRDFTQASMIFDEVSSMISLNEHPMLFVRMKVGMADLALRQQSFDVARGHLEELSTVDVLAVAPSYHYYYLATRAQLHALTGDEETAFPMMMAAVESARSRNMHDELNTVLVAALELFTDGQQRSDLLEEYFRVHQHQSYQTPYGIRTIVNLRERQEAERLRIAMERQRERSQIIAETQTRTVNSIGRDLHDSIGQDVTVLSMLVDQLAEKQSSDDTEAAYILATMRTIAQRLSHDSRRIAHRLAANNVTAATLLPALNQAVAEAQVALPALNFALSQSGALDEMTPEIALTFFRTVQTSLTNVMHHSKASTCSINLVAHDDHFHLDIEDDGVGFDLATLSGGMGLREARARAEQLGGNLRIDSAVGKGTYVEVTIPKPAPQPKT